MDLLVQASSSDPTVALAQYGAIGAIALIALGAVRVLFNREVGSHQRDTERADAEHLENLRLNALMLEKVIPAVILAGQAVAASATLLQQIKYSNDVTAEAARNKEQKNKEDS